MIHPGFPDLSTLPPLHDAQNQVVPFKDVRTWIEDLTLHAGALFRQEFHHPQGPRGSGSKAPIDSEVERILRKAIQTRFPTHGVYAEECPSSDRPPQRSGGYTWYIDPNVDVGRRYGQL